MSIDVPHEEVTVEDPDGLVSVVLRWLPEGGPRAVVHVLHGWAEHAGRYQRLGCALAGRGYAVYADDHRGHGQSGVRNDSLGELGPRGGHGVLDAVHAVTQRAAREHPGLPVFVLGHSWGSFLLQRYVRRWSSEIVGALLTGTTHRDPGAPQAPRVPPNDRFEPARTPYDWLSRDEDEVDRYIADPLCGFEIMRDRPATATAAAPSGGAGGADPTAGRKVDPGLPVLIFNGGDDPIGGETGGHALGEHYRALGLEDVSVRIYPGARHELFNETNRDEVIADVIDWLDARTSDGDRDVLEEPARP